MSPVETFLIGHLSGLMIAFIILVTLVFLTKRKLNRSIDTFSKNMAQMSELLAAQVKEQELQYLKRIMREKAEEDSTWQ